MQSGWVVKEVTGKALVVSCDFTVEAGSALLRAGEMWSKYLN